MRSSEIKKRLHLFFCDKVFTIMFLLFALCFFSTILSVIIPSESLSVSEMNSNSTTTVGDVYDEQSLEFTFHSVKPKLLGMSFSIATYGRVLTDGILNISVIDEAGTAIFSQEINGSSIHDNSVINVAIPKQLKSNNQTYTVSFQTSGIDVDHAITFWANNKSLDGVSTILNGVSQQTTLVYSLAYISNSYKYTWYLLLLSTFFFVLSVVSFGRNRSIG